MSLTKGNHDDPRDSSLEKRLTLPKTWSREAFDGLNTSGMFLSGLIMVTRNRYLAWPAVLFGINGLINQHPLRTKEGGANTWSNLAMCVFALIASYIPIFVVTNPKPSPS